MAPPWPAPVSAAARVALLLLLSCRCLEGARLPEAYLGERSVDLVIAWYCEDLSWLRSVSHTFAEFMTVLVYNKGGRWCKKGLPSLPFRVLAEHLENVGRDGHTQATHIARHYDDLADFTFFLQGDAHWTMRPLGQPEEYRHVMAPEDVIAGWSSQADMLNDLVPRVLAGHDRVIPIVAQRAGRGPVLFEDKEYEEQERFLLDRNVARFPVVRGDYYNGGRELRAIMFGGTPCEVGAQVFTPGMQFAAHREVLRRRPLRVWERLADALEHCFLFIWYYERNLLNVLNESLDMTDPDDWQQPSFCQDDPPAYEGWDVDTSTGAERRGAFWREAWGCDPWSDEMHEQMEKLRDEERLRRSRRKGEL